MADCLIQANVAGPDNLILIAGTADCILHTPPEVVVAVGGPSGGRTKAKGYKLVSDQLGNRPVKHITDITKSKLKLRSETMSKGMLQVPSKNITYSIVKPFHFVGFSTSQLQMKIRTESAGLIKKLTHNHATAYIVLSIEVLRPKLNTIKRGKKIIELFGLYQLSQMAESTDNIFTIPKKVQTFDFEETAEQWAGILTEQRFRAFTASSSFVGNVRYDRDEQSMRILLNGIPYQFCNVPERIFDSFEGANSKGAFFNRNIKTQFDC